jgi:hypothetical protein
MPRVRSPFFLNRRRGIRFLVDRPFCCICLAIHQRWLFRTMTRVRGVYSAAGAGLVRLSVGADASLGPGELMVVEEIIRVPLI